MKPNVSSLLRFGRSRLLASPARLSLVLLFACSLLATLANAAPLVYVITITQQFGTVDLATGDFTAIGGQTADLLGDLMWAPDGSGNLLSLGTSANPGYLVEIDPSTGVETPLRPITYNGSPLGLNAFSLAELHGKLYLTDFSNNLYTVNFETGVARPVGQNGGTTGLRPDANIPFTYNSDGTFNLCDEGFYESDGKIYATFDAFAITTTSTPPTIAHLFLSPYVWQIDPRTGAATFVANTDTQITAIVKTDGQFYAFKGVLDGFTNGFPVAHGEVYTLNIETGKTEKVADISDPGIGIVLGAVPVHKHQ
jgi:hypothetical protein